MLVWIAVELAVAEVAAEEAELPHVIGDIFADVAHRAVGADDYFLVFFRNLVTPSLCGRGARAYAVCACTILTGSGAAHDPAGFVLGFTLEGEHTRFFELGEGGVPEVQMQDLALARPEVIFGVDALNGRGGG